MTMRFNIILSVFHYLLPCIRPCVSSRHSLWLTCHNIQVKEQESSKPCIYNLFYYGLHVMFNIEHCPPKLCCHNHVINKLHPCSCSVAIGEHYSVGFPIHLWSVAVNRLIIFPKHTQTSIRLS